MVDRVDVRVTGKPVLKTGTGDVARGVPRRDAEILEKLQRVEILAPPDPEEPVVFTPAADLTAAMADEPERSPRPKRGETPPEESRPRTLTTDAAPIVRKRGRKPKA